MRVFQQKTLGWLFIFIAIFLALNHLSSDFNLLVSKTKTNFTCSLGASQFCHDSIVSSLDSKTGFSYLVFNCYNSGYAKSCLTASSVLQKRGDNNFVYYLQKSCFLGHKPSCLLTTEAALQLWKKEMESDKAINSSGKYISLAFNSISQGCVLKDKVACAKYSEHWANISMRRAKFEYDCINGNQQACLTYNKLIHEQKNIAWLDKNYFSLKAKGFTSLKCKVKIREPYTINARANRRLASRTVLSVNIFADLINNTISYDYDRLVKTDLEVLLRRLAKEDLIDAALPLILNGYSSIYKGLQYAYNRSGWYYFQHQTPNKETYYLTFNQKDGRHYYTPPDSVDYKQVMLYEKTGPLFFPRKIITTKKYSNKYNQHSYNYNWIKLSNQGLYWPNNIHSLSKGDTARSPLVRVDFDFEHCKFKIKNKTHKINF